MILHLCTKNLNMIYSSWGIGRDRLKLVILGHFCCFIPLKTKKIEILKKWKKITRDIILHVCTKNHNHMMYDSWDTEWDT